MPITRFPIKLNQKDKKMFINKNDCEWLKITIFTATRSLPLN